MTNALTLAAVRGTMTYCPPEIYEGQLFFPQSDIYSLGIVLWELVQRVVTGQYVRPFEEYDHIIFDFQIIVQTSKCGLRPTIPKECPKVIEQLITDCWQQDSDKRPSCQGLLVRLAYLLGEMNGDSSKIDSLSV